MTDKSEMKALERVERRLNNAWAKHGFMTLTVSDLREVVSLARASSRPADQVPDMVERDLYFATLLQQDTCAVVPVNRDHLKSVIADAKAALQAVPASREVRELRELLVEAQRHVADLAALPCEAVGPENAESCSCDPCRARSLNERIDFALKASGEE